MNALTRKTVLTLLASLALVTFAALPAAAQSRLLLVAPESDPGLTPDYCLPQFGFSSFNVGGVGERVTFVRWGGIASRLGLEPGDILLSMNGYRLSYPGAWNDALYNAMASGGWVQLRIRDVRTGIVAYRQTFVGGGIGVGPIVQHYNAGGIGSSHVSHRASYSNGPVSARSTAGASHRSETSRTIREIARLFD